MLRFSRPRCALAVVCALTVSSAVLAADGDFDTSFAGDGTTRFDIANPNNVPLDFLDALTSVALVNGKLIAAGVPEVDDTDTYPNPPLFFARLTPNGTLEFSHTVGVADATPGFGVEIDVTLVAPTGDVYVAGGRSNNGFFQAIAQRYNSAGVFQGIYTRATSASDQSYCAGVFVDPAGKILLGCIVGYDEADPTSARAAVLRFNANFTPDSGFSGDGEVIFPTTPPGGCNDGFEVSQVIQQSSGDYVVAANCYSIAPDDKESSSLHVFKIAANGTPVTSGFGTGGLLTLPIPNAEDPSPDAIAIDPATGKVYLGGEDFHESNSSASQVFFVRFNPATGVLDNTFDGDGVLTRLNNSGSGYGFSAEHLVPQAQEKLVVMGRGDLFRMNANGSLDTSFSSKRSFNFTDGFIGGSLFGMLVTDGGSRAVIVGGVEDFCIENPGRCGSGPQLSEAIVGKVKLTSDTTPDSFTFTDRTGVALNTFVPSNTITAGGFDGAATISVGGDQGSVYSIGCTGGGFTSNVGNISEGQTVCVGHTSANSGNASRNTTLNINGVTDTYTTTTLTPDTTPDGYANFTAQTGVPLNSLRTSNAQVINGINSPTTISVSGAQGSQYDIGCDGGPVSAVGSISNGQSVCVLHTSSGTATTTVTSTLTIGGVARGFSSTTSAGPDTTPNAFSFADQTNLATGTARSSNSISVGGINTAAPISISGGGGTYRINNTGDFVSTAGSVNNGDTVQLRLTSSINPNAATSTTLNIGGVTDGFTLTTGATDTSPTAFTFPDITNANSSVVRTSATRTLAGFNTPVSVTLTGGATARLLVNGVDVTASPGNVNPGDTVALQLTVPAAGGVTTSARLRVGTYSTLWSVTSNVDTTPTAFVFPNVSNAVAGQTRNSAARTIGGINVPTPISLSGDASARLFVNSVDRTADPGSVSRGDRIFLRLTAPAAGNSASATVTVGGYSTTWMVSTP